MKSKLNIYIVIVIASGVLTMFSIGCTEENQVNSSELETQVNSLSLKSLSAILFPQNITNVDGRFYVENQTTPKDTAYITVRWQDNVPHSGNAISISPTYNPATYTGYSPPSPLSSWQKGEYDDATNGSSVFQLNGTSGGILMNSWFTTYQTIVGGGQNTSYAYEFSTPASPWSTSTSKLWIQADLKLPWYANWDINTNGNYPVGQLSYFCYLTDTTINQSLAIIINAYDNRSQIPSESIQTDTYTYFASTRFGGTKYCTPNQYSASWRSTTWNTYSFYRAEITRQNIVNVATDANSQYNQNFSLNPDNYLLTSVGILQETFREQGDQVSMGSSFKDFSVYEDN